MLPSQKLNLFSLALRDYLKQDYKNPLAVKDFHPVDGNLFVGGENKYIIELINAKTSADSHKELLKVSVVPTPHIVFYDLSLKEKVDKFVKDKAEEYGLDSLINS
jgi:hypothetical protein